MLTVVLQRIIMMPEIDIDVGVVDGDMTVLGVFCLRIGWMLERFFLFWREHLTIVIDFFGHVFWKDFLPFEILLRLLLLLRRIVVVWLLLSVVLVVVRLGLELGVLRVLQLLLLLRHRLRLRLLTMIGRLLVAIRLLDIAVRLLVIVLHTVVLMLRLALLLLFRLHLLNLVDLLHLLLLGVRNVMVDHGLRSLPVLCGDGGGIVDRCIRHSLAVRRSRCTGTVGRIRTTTGS